MTLEMSLSTVRTHGVGVPSTRHRTAPHWIVRVVDTPRELTYPGTTPEASASTMFTAETTAPNERSRPDEQRSRPDEQRSRLDLEAMSNG